MEQIDDAGAVPETMDAPPRVFLAILAKQSETVLPLYLACIAALDYPKKSIVLHVRTNNNTDGTEDMLRRWIARVGERYAQVEFDAADVPEPVEQCGIHEWNAMRFKVLGRLRQASLQRAFDLGCDFYFAVDVDNFIRPHTLRELVAVRLPIVAPLLRCVDQRKDYSNFHETVDLRGYYVRSDAYYWLLQQRVKGLCQVPVVHCTYLVRRDVIPLLAYEDGSGRHEYVVFAESARRQGVAQYLDTRDVYGYLTLEENARDAMKLLGAEVGTRLLAGRRPGMPGLFVCFGLHSSGSTWMFNLARDICRASGIDFDSCHRESEENLPWDAAGSRAIIVKSHNPFAGFQAFISGSSEPAVVTVRDPRDAVASLMQRFGTSFDEALRTVADSARSLDALARQRDLPVFRYEDGFIGAIDTFDRIARMLGATVPPDRRDAILADLAPEAVKRTIAALTNAGIVRHAGDAFDRATHWHANHVGDGEVGKHARLLSEAQRREVLKQTADFCRRFGYDVPGEAAVQAPSPVAMPSAPVTAAPPPRKIVSRRQTICLAMIVKNEAPVIERCLASVLPLIDHWTIVDTGSTDGTQAVIRRYMKDLPGILHERPWVDFAHNRSEALAFARPHGDYTLIIDADDVLMLPPGFKLPFLKADSYAIEIRNKERRYWRPQLVRNALAWRYEGVVHEFLSCPAGSDKPRSLPEELSFKRLPGVHIQMSEDGARRRSTAAERFRRDAAILESALAGETDDFLVARYTFYLAQSLMDFGDKPRALDFYRRRATQTRWPREVFISLLRVARLMEELGHADDEVIAAYLAAHRASPDRAEPLHGAARLCRMRQRYAEGYDIARRGVGLKIPDVGLFIEDWIYDYGLLDELAVNAYWIGKFDECLKVCRRLLQTPTLPGDHRQRVEANANYARDKLRDAQGAGAAAR